MWLRVRTEPETICRMALHTFKSALLSVILAWVFSTRITGQSDTDDSGVADQRSDALILRARDLGSQRAREAVDFAVDSYNSKSNQECLYEVVNFQSKLQPVVIGEEYILQVVIRLTRCRKGNDQNLNNCEDCNGPNQMLHCRFVVLMWRETRVLLQSVCRETP